MPALASSAQLKRLCTNLCDAGTMYPKHRDHNKVEGFFQMCVRQDLCFSNSTVNNGGRSDSCERGQIISRTKAEHFYRGRYLMRTTAISLQRVLRRQLNWILSLWLMTSFVNCDRAEKGCARVSLPSQATETNMKGVESPQCVSFVTKPGSLWYSWKIFAKKSTEAFWAKHA